MQFRNVAYDDKLIVVTHRCRMRVLSPQGFGGRTASALRSCSPAADQKPRPQPGQARSVRPRTLVVRCNAEQSQDVGQFFGNVGVPTKPFCAKQLIRHSASFDAFGARPVFCCSFPFVVSKMRVRCNFDVPISMCELGSPCSKPCRSAKSHHHGCRLLRLTSPALVMPPDTSRSPDWLREGVRPTGANSVCRPKAGRIIDRSTEGPRHDCANPRHCHEATANWIVGARVFRDRPIHVLWTLGRAASVLSRFPASDCQQPIPECGSQTYRARSRPPPGRSCAADLSDISRAIVFCWIAFRAPRTVRVS